MEGHTSMIRREPVGVVASIAPWNYPIMMAGWKIGPALAAGNTVVLKPSARTPLTALVLAELAADILPPGVLNVITGTGGDIGDALVGHPKVGMVSVTGDTDTGKHIAKVAADKVKRLHLELGGKAPVIVFDDADLDAVAEAIKLWGYWNAGQDCTAATRVITGPKNDATRAVPRDCTVNNATRMITVSGTTYFCSGGAAISKPSTADSTEMAGVISASP
jgi:acyl-CoA reductase-like NAD-dependent aldehyde dehydrogenase